MKTDNWGLAAVCVGALLGGCEAGARPEDPPGVMRGAEAREFLAKVREETRSLSRERVRVQAEEELERTETTLELLERARAGLAALLAVVEELPPVLLSERDVLVLEQSVEASRAWNRDLEELGIRPSGENSLAVAERQLSRHREVAALRADATLLVQAWGNVTPMFDEGPPLSGGDLSAMAQNVDRLIAEGRRLEARLLGVK